VLGHGGEKLGPRLGPVGAEVVREAMPLPEAVHVSPISVSLLATLIPPRRLKPLHGSARLPAARARAAARPLLPGAGRARGGAPPRRHSCVAPAARRSDARSGRRRSEAPGARGRGPRAAAPRRRGSPGASSPPP